MRSASRTISALLLAVAVDLAAAAPVKPVVPCDRPVYVFGGGQVAGVGVRDPGKNDFATRIDTFFTRVCGHEVRFEVVTEEGGRVVPAAATIAGTIARNPRSIAFVHFPVSDVENGASVDALLDAYRWILDACTKTGSTCIIGGQTPVNAFNQAQSDRQLEVEHRAAAVFGSSYLPLYRYFQSESSRRRLMLPVDAGDGRLVDDIGHELLFNIYRRRLLETTGARR